MNLNQEQALEIQRNAKPIFYAECKLNNENLVGIEVGNIYNVLAYDYHENSIFIKDDNNEMLFHDAASFILMDKLTPKHIFNDTWKEFSKDIKPEEMLDFLNKNTPLITELLEQIKETNEEEQINKEIEAEEAEAEKTKKS